MQRNARRRHRLVPLTACQVSFTSCIPELAGSLGNQQSLHSAPSAEPGGAPLGSVIMGPTYRRLRSTDLRFVSSTTCVSGT